MDYINKIIQGDTLDVLKKFRDNVIDCCITSPPYWGLRDYGTATWEGGDINCKHFTNGDGGFPGEKQKTNKGSLRIAKDVCPLCGAVRIDNQIGLEKTPEEYVNKLTKIFHEIKRVLKPEGTCWLNLGDSYTGSRGMGSFVDSKAKKGMIIIKDYHRSGSVGNIQPKNLVGIPWRVAFALQTDGWFLRQDLIWSKPNPMPESVKDRCTKSHEYIFLLTKSPHYYYDYKAILEPAAYDGRADTYFKGSKKYKDSGQTFAKRGHERWPNKLQDQTGLHTHKYNPKLIGHTGDNHSGYFDEGGRPRATLNNDGIFARNKRSVWTVSTKPFKGAHFATFPPELITPMILAGCPKGGLILDPFMGAGTSALVAKYHNRNYTGIELNEKYIVLAEERLKQAFYPSNPLKCPF